MHVATPFKILVAPMSMIRKGFSTASFNIPSDRFGIILSIWVTNSDKYFQMCFSDPSNHVLLYHWFIRTPRIVRFPRRRPCSSYTYNKSHYESFLDNPVATKKILTNCQFNLIYYLSMFYHQQKYKFCQLWRKKKGFLWFFFSSPALSLFTTRFRIGACIEVYVYWARSWWGRTWSRPGSCSPLRPRGWPRCRGVY